MENGYRFNEHDLADIFRSVWGYTAPPFLFSLQSMIENAIFKKHTSSDEYSFDPVPERREYSRLSVPYYANNNNGNEMFLPIWLIRPDRSQMLLQNTVSSFTNKKTIVETPLVNRQGTVKEEISVNDWDINIKGLIVSIDMDYPEDDVTALKELYDLGVVLGIQNVRSAIVLKDTSEQVVIRSLRFPEIKGMRNVQAFEMDLSSDIPFALKIE
ncbi:DUF6046 domain-containing protein [Dysgonomonas sp. ZJ709]|uniref:DUF6046 domain-containing protein n=1 Tax=Dysgonomonas sp. ZJ709 TaxID=2709797 RepID=UPI0013EC468B|nr:DUF6046 domain-containing protein [Dysgonomonas sp. ZJ709]